VHAAHLRADGAEVDAGGPGRVGDRGDQLQDGLRPGIGGEVEVAVGALRPAQQRVPDRPADQVQLVPGPREEAAEQVGGLGHRHEVGGGHHGAP
jgi:hypothetical protein